MIKVGITKVDDILAREVTPFRKEPRNVTITLYEKVQGRANAAELAERILLWYSDERGAYKRTYENRFEEFDATVVALLKEYFAPRSVVAFHDVAVSDGRTSVDFFRKIAGVFENLSFVASDYTCRLRILEQGRLKVTLGHADNILEILWPPFVFSTTKRDSYRHYPINHLIRLLLEHTMVNPLVHAYHCGQVKAREMLLFAPKVLSTAREDRRFVLDHHDLLEPFKAPCHVLRVMNVLNPKYFSQGEFSRVIRHIHAALLDRGLLITGSNQEAGTLVHGGLYQKTDRGFEKVWQSGEGSSIEHHLIR